MAVAEDLPGPQSLVDVLRYRAARQPGDYAYIFLSDRGQEVARLTFAELERLAAIVAARLSSHTHPGDRVLLVFPPGLDFLISFYGCLLAGAIAVPIMVPRRTGGRDWTAAIVADCAPRVALTSPELARLRPELAARFAQTQCAWLVADPADESSVLKLPVRPPAELAFLQYTSGSTSLPKGVMVTHRNLIANLGMIRTALGNARSSTHVSWVPLYHDMGLILNALGALYVGALCVLMAPVTFMQRPLVWLRAIDRYRAEVAGAPNFAFDLCVARFRAEQLVGVDLSSWKVAFNGAEPVRASSLRQFAETFKPYGFSAAALYPCYGLAEATLMVSGRHRGVGPITRAVSRASLLQGQIHPPANDDDCGTLVGCGRSLPGEQLAIVDAETGALLGPGIIGEIWVAGPNVAAGYWQKPEISAATFQASLAGRSDQCWLRTGDLGFVDEQGELFITGRIKDVIIIRGMNHYPQDIEDTVQNCHPALRRNCGAAFTVLGSDGQEELVVVQEVERTHLHRLSAAELTADIREAVATEHELRAHDVQLIRPGSIPKTTSGKIQRNLTRVLWRDRRLETIE